MCQLSYTHLLNWGPPTNLLLLNLGSYSQGVTHQIALSNIVWPKVLYALFIEPKILKILGGNLISKIQGIANYNK